MLWRRSGPVIVRVMRWHVLTVLMRIARIAFVFRPGVSPRFAEWRLIFSETITRNLVLSTIIQVTIHLIRRGMNRLLSKQLVVMVFILHTLRKASVPRIVPFTRGSSRCLRTRRRRRRRRVLVIKLTVVLSVRVLILIRWRLLLVTRPTFRGVQRLFVVRWCRWRTRRSRCGRGRITWTRSRETRAW